MSAVFATSRMAEFVANTRFAANFRDRYHSRMERAAKTIAIRALYESLGERATATYAEFTAALQGWDVTPIIDQHEIIGAVVRLGPEIHVGAIRTPHGAARGLLLATLADTITEHGCAMTKVMKDNPAGRAFCERLGFELIGGDHQTWYMGCNHARHARKERP